MAGGSEQAGSSLEVTPTWATAAICSIIVLVSILLQRAIHYAGIWTKSKDSKPLKNALNNMKEELMLLGVISLLLAVSQPFTTEICVSHTFIETMLPCKSRDSPVEKHDTTPTTNNQHRKLLQQFVSINPVTRRQMLAAPSGRCASKGKTSIFGATDIHDLHMFIFMLAVVHISYSLLTIFLGGKKIHSWKNWETEAHNCDSDKILASYKPKFVQRHVRNSSRLTGTLVAFVQQFGWSVTKEDYYTLRHAFTHKHQVDKGFDFHWYLRRSIADDFKAVVGISEYFWLFVIVFFLLNVHGWHTYFWISFIPIILLLVLGAKLQYILGSLAVDIMNSPEEAVQLRDEIFWFGRPKLLLHLLHFSLFQNAFELGLFFWMVATFGFNSCLLANRATAILHITTGVIIQIQCSYKTLPLYALLSQMGSGYEEKLVEEQRSVVLDEADKMVVDVNVANIKDPGKVEEVEQSAA